MNTTNKLSMEFAENVCVQNTYHGHLLEANKGSNPNIYKHRVALEPNFRKYNVSNMFFASRKRPSLINRALKHKNKVQLARIFFPLKDKMYWHHYEEAICSLSGLSDFVSFEIVGNENGTKFFIGSLNKDIIGTIVGCWRSFLPDISYEYSNDPVAEISNSKALFFMKLFKLFH